MAGYLVVRKRNLEEVNRERNLPYDEYDFNGIYVRDAYVGGIFEGLKVGYHKIISRRNFEFVISKDFKVNFNDRFYYSCLVRALDYLMVRVGSDLRFREVVVSDPINNDARCILRLLLPFARRITIITKEREKFYSEVEYALKKYGTSIGISSDPVLALQNADAVVISSKDMEYKCLLEKNIPILFLNFPYKPESKFLFDDVGLSFNYYDNLDVSHAQGYVDALNLKEHFRYAEDDGFRISTLKRNNSQILIR